MATNTVRYRARMGNPRSTFERFLQVVWCWRVELTLLYLAVMVALIFFFEFKG